MHLTEPTELGRLEHCPACLVPAHHKTMCPWMDAVCDRKAASLLRTPCNHNPHPSGAIKCKDRVCWPLRERGVVCLLIMKKSGQHHPRRCDGASGFVGLHVNNKRTFVSIRNVSGCMFVTAPEFPLLDRLHDFGNVVYAHRGHGTGFVPHVPGFWVF